MRKFTIAAFLCASLGLIASPVAADPQRTATMQVESRGHAAAVQPSAQEVDEDAARYAQAEQEQPQAAEFVGGSTVVIAASTTTIVLAIILLLVLL